MSAATFQLLAAIDYLRTTLQTLESRKAQESMLCQDSERLQAVNNRTVINLINSTMLRATRHLGRVLLDNWTVRLTNNSQHLASGPTLKRKYRPSSAVTLPSPRLDSQTRAQLLRLLLSDLVSPVESPTWNPPSSRPARSWVAMTGLQCPSRKQSMSTAPQESAATGPPSLTLPPATRRSHPTSRSARTCLQARSQVLLYASEAAASDPPWLKIASGTLGHVPRRHAQGMRPKKKDPR